MPQIFFRDISDFQPLNQRFSIINHLIQLEDVSWTELIETPSGHFWQIII